MILYLILFLQVITLAVVVVRKAEVEGGKPPELPKVFLPDETDVLDWTPPGEEEKKTFRNILKRIRK